MDFKNDTLLKRASIINEITSGFITSKFEDFISEREEMEFQNSFRNSDDLAKYLTYKIVFLYEKKAKIIIFKMTNEFLVKDERSPEINLYWSNSYNIEYELKKPLIYANFLKTGDIGSVLMKSYREKSFSIDQQKKLKNSKNCKEYLETMQKQYESIKSKVMSRKKTTSVNKKASPRRNNTKRNEFLRKIQTIIHEKSVSPNSKKKTFCFSESSRKNKGDSETSSKRFEKLIQKFKEKAEIKNE